MNSIRHFLIIKEVQMDVGPNSVFVAQFYPTSPVDRQTDELKAFLAFYSVLLYSINILYTANNFKI